MCNGGFNKFLIIDFTIPKLFTPNLRKKKIYNYILD